MCLVLLLQTKAARFSFEALKTKHFIKVSANIFACSCQWIVQKSVNRKRGSLEMSGSKCVWFFFLNELFKGIKIFL